MNDQQKVNLEIYEMVPIRLDLSSDWSCNFITLYTIRLILTIR